VRAILHPAFLRPSGDCAIGKLCQDDGDALAQTFQGHRLNIPSVFGREQQNSHMQTIKSNMQH
jgi:hypothetical protein